MESSLNDLSTHFDKITLEDGTTLDDCIASMAQLDLCTYTHNITLTIKPKKTLTPYEIDKLVSSLSQHQHWNIVIQ